MKFYEVQAIAANACEMGKHQFRRAMLSDDSSCFLFFYFFIYLFIYFNTKTT